MLIALVIFHVVVGLGVYVAGTVLGRRAFMVAAAAPLATLVWLATRLDALLDNRTITTRLDWVPRLNVEVALRLDAFGAVMVLAVSGIGLCVMAYSWYYFEPPRHSSVQNHDRDVEGHARLAGLLTMFAGSMLGVVIADDLITLFTAWELTSITSYLLIGFEHRKIQARAAALHALLVTSAGGLVMLAGIVLIAGAAGTYRLSEILADPPSGAAVTAGLVCVVVGAFTKSAQYPFHSWLPGAMAAPTPVSAYLHSATMVKAGVYLLGRFAPAFAAIAPWRPLVVGVGLATMIAGGLRALRQYDLKLLLAYGTVSQLGLLVVLFGAGTPEATAAGVTLILAHATFKAALFLCVGIVERQTGTRDIRLLPPLGAGWLPTTVVTALTAASMAGVPLLAGFIAKESAYTAFIGGPFSQSSLVLAGVVAGSALTTAYSLRLLWGLWLLPRRIREGTEQVSVRIPDSRAPDVTPAPSPSPGFLAPAATLAAVSFAIGVAPRLVDRLVGAATIALEPLAAPSHLGLWHGFTWPLALTAVTFTVGGTLFAARRAVARVLAVGQRVPNGTELYLALLQGLNHLATRVTAIVQNGTLSIYAGVVLTTAAVLPGTVLLRRVEWPGWPDVIGHPAQIPITVVLMLGALSASIVRRRFTAVLYLSTVGYGMAALFVVQGAPDLALTQAAIETLSTVLFVLVLRQLPDRFERRSNPLTRTIRIVVAVAVAMMVFSFAVIARDARTAEPVSSEIVERALPDANGRNVVNNILVDFRAFDTMGEITVLAAASIGAVALARAGRKPRPTAPARPAATLETPR